MYNLTPPLLETGVELRVAPRGAAGLAAAPVRQLRGQRAQGRRRRPGRQGAPSPVEAETEIFRVDIVHSGVLWCKIWLEAD